MRALEVAPVGIYYDPPRRRLHLAEGRAEASWVLVTHDASASAYHCRRIMREWLDPADLFAIDWAAFDRTVRLRRPV